KSNHLQEADIAVERNGEHIAELHRMSRRGLAHAVDADMPALDEFCGAGAGFHHPRMPQELVEALAIQWKDYSLRPASCSFSAASFANGELGSAARSRSRGFCELA